MITKLQALTSGTAGNSTGDDVAYSVNALIDENNKFNEIFLNSIAERGAWTPSTDYYVNNIWQHTDDTWYLVLTSYTSHSSNISLDVAGGKVVPYKTGLFNENRVDVTKFGAGFGDSYASISNAITYLKSLGGGTLVFSKISAPYSVSNELLIDFGNVKIEIHSPIILTKTTKASALKIAGTSSISMIQNVTIQMFEGAYIDGNGDNITGYTYGTDSNEYSSITMLYVDGYKIIDGDFRNGLVSSVKAFRCLNGLINNSEFSGAIHDNGLSIVSDSSNYSDSDPTTWARAKVIGCKAYGNKDFGFTSLDASGVIFRDCEAWLNGCEVGSSGAPEGGGFSYEDDYITPNVKQYKGALLNCKSYSSIANGILITASGVVVDKDCIFENVTTTWAGANPQFYGNGAYLIDSKNIVFNGWARKCSRAGLYAIGTSADGFIDAEIGGRFSENGYQSILMNGVNNIKLLPTLETSKAGETSSIASVEINNLSLNPNEGVVKVLGGWHESNPNAAVSINKVRYAMVDGVAGLNNSLLSNNAQIIVKNTADARVCSIDMPSSGTPFYTASCEATCTTARMFDISGAGTIAPYVNSATNKNMFGGSLVTASAWADAVAQGQFINLQTRLDTAGILRKT